MPLVRPDVLIKTTQDDSRRLKTTQDGASHQMESALLVVEPIVEEYILSRVKHLPQMMDPQSMKA